MVTTDASLKAQQQDDFQSSLCDVCAKINWDLLRPPTMAQLRSLTTTALDTRADTPDFDFVRRATSKAMGCKISLGGFCRIEASSTCPLCQVALQTLSLINSSSSSNNNNNNNNNNSPPPLHELECQAQIITDLAKVVIKPSHGQVIYPAAKCLWSRKSRPFQFPLPFLRLSWSTKAGIRAGTGEPSLAMTRYVCAFDARDQPVFDANLNASPVLAGRFVPERIDFRLVRHWFDHCKKHHAIEKRFRGLQEKPIENFTLWHIKEKRLQPLPSSSSSGGVLPSHHEFAALSYVWGKQERNPDPANWPQSVKDACVVAENLGLEYIWIDEVCINNDTNDALHQHLTAMGHIYAAAAVTIICACGQDATAPLAGVSQARVNRQTSFRVPVPDGADPLHVISSPRLLPQRSWLVTDASAWGTRGWTLQEAALSHRILTITDDEVYWQCSVTSDYRAESHFTEIENYCTDSSYQASPQAERTEAVAETESAEPSAMTRSRVVQPVFPVFPIFTSATYLNMERNPLLVMEAVLSDFLVRKLSFEGDALNAILSILQIASKLADTKFRWGLPQKAFEQGLCWRRSRGPGSVWLKRRTSLTNSTYEQLKRRESLPNLSYEEEKRSYFPSWSPLGWHGRLANSFSRETSKGLQMFVQCYVHTVDKNDSRIEFALASTVCKGTAEHKETEQQTERENENKEPSRPKTSDLIKGMFSYEKLTNFVQGTLLFFYAETARLTVRYPKAPRLAKGDKPVTLPIYLKLPLSHKRLSIEAGMTDWCNVGDKSDPLNENEASGEGEPGELEEDMKGESDDKELEGGFEKEFEFVLLGYRRRKDGNSYVALQVTEEPRWGKCELKHGGDNKGGPLEANDEEMEEAGQGEDGGKEKQGDIAHAHAHAHVDGHYALEHWPAKPGKRKRTAGDEAGGEGKDGDHSRDESKERKEPQVVYRLGLALIKPEVWKQASRTRRLVALG